MSDYIILSRFSLKPSFSLNKKLIYNMETESSLEIKEFYGIQLKRLLPCLGLGTVRWLSTLLPLVSNFTQIPTVSESHFELPNFPTPDI